MRDKEIVIGDVLRGAGTRHLIGISRHFMGGYVRVDFL